MPDYQKMYIKLAVAMAKSIEEMQKAMQEAEEIYILEESLTIKNFPKKEEEDSLK